MNLIEWPPMAQSIRGKVYLVGAGPGDPKLLTLRGKELLAQAEMIIYDYLANPALLEFSQDSAEKIYAGKKGGTDSASYQDDLNRRMIQAAQEGKFVVRLKGGDPFIFGRGGEEAEALAEANIPFEVVPGVSSAIGVPAYAGIPLSHRNIASSIGIITGHQDINHPEKKINWAKLATGCDTLVFLMGMGNLPTIITQLIQHGKDPKTPMALIQWGTHPYQKTVIGTVDNIQEKIKQDKINPPVVMVIGAVVNLRDQMNWFETRPLFRKRIVVTRARENSAEFSDMLSLYGAEVILFPTLKIVPPPDFVDLDNAITHIDQYNTIIFTSVNGVQSFYHRLRQLGYDIRILKGISLCAIGPKTREAISALGLLCDFIPSEYTAEGIMDALEKQGVLGKRFLLPRAMQAREVLPEFIIKQGGQIDVVPAYQAIPPAEDEIAPILQKGPIDMLTFGSASTVKNFIDRMNPKMREFVSETAIACIGPITAEAAVRCGLRVDLVPKEYTFRALTESIVQYYIDKKN